MNMITLPSNPAEVPELPKAFHLPHSALHRDQFAGDNAAIKLMADTVGGAWEVGNTINELRANPNPEHRAATHDRVVREKVESERTKFIGKFERAKAGLAAELKRVESDLLAKSGLKPNPVHFDAITAAFHGMKPAQRVETINELIEQGDHASLATLIEAPLFLTGLNAEQRDAIKQRVYLKVDPKGVELRDYLNVCLERADSAANASVIMFGQLQAGTEEGAWKVRAQQAAVHAARENHLKR
jgi:hypothetical protein